MKKFYRGRIVGDSRIVEVVEKDDVGNIVMSCNLAPAGGHFGWGDFDPSSRVTAQAILTDALGSGLKALELHRSFSVKVISRLDMSKPWEMSQEAVLLTVRQIEAIRRGIDAELAR